MVSSTPKNFSSRIIYVSLFAVLLIAIITNASFTPARLRSASQAFSVIENLEVSENKVAFAGFEYGPGTQAENDPQARVVLEHLFRKNIPIVIFTTYALAEKFSIDTPQAVADAINKERLAANSNEKNLIVYGENWITVGYRPGGALFFQALSQSKNVSDFLGKDVRGSLVSSYPHFSKIKTLGDVSIVAYFTGLVGMLNTYIQFLQSNGVVPTMVHGCTSISIPEAFIFLESGQLKGLLEGVGGAASYSRLLRERFEISHPLTAEIANSILGIGQLFILFLIIAGNIAGLYVARRSRGNQHG